jgi:hypothetical protein
MPKLEKDKMHDQFKIEHTMGTQPQVQVDQEPTVAAPYESDIVESIDSSSDHEKNIATINTTGLPAEIVSDFEEESTPKRGLAEPDLSNIEHEDSSNLTP